MWAVMKIQEIGNYKLAPQSVIGFIASFQEKLLEVAF